MSITTDTASVSTFAKPPVPVIDKIHQRVYRAASKPGALNMLWFHCGTAHCRAGHVVVIAGKSGQLLENFEWDTDGNTGDAAAAIYRVSSSIEPMVGAFRGSVTNDEALADMKRCADEEAALVGVLRDDE